MIIIGKGRVGGALLRRAERQKVPCVGVSREAGWKVVEQDDSAGPILVTTNADDLETVIDRIEPARRADLVFIQNGMIDELLLASGCGGNTRGLLYFAVPERGAEIQPGGESLFAGPHASSMANWFHAVELGADTVERMEFSNEMMSKLIWNSTFGLLCDVYKCSVGSLVLNHRGCVDSLVHELCGVANEAAGTTLDPVETAESLCAYSLSIADYRGTVKQWQWRNGWFVEAARARALQLPNHGALLTRRLQSSELR